MASAVGQAPTGARLLQFSLYVWYLLWLLLSGAATLALYVVTPLALLKTQLSKTLQRSGERDDGERKARLCRIHESCTACHWLLQPVRPSDQGKMTVVLDLDETLISSHEAGKVPCGLRVALARHALQAVELSCDEKSERQSSRVVMFLRPGLLEFLQRLTRFAEVVLFTAGVPAYAKPLADALDPAHRFFTARLYRNHTVKTVWHNYVKDLSKLGRDLRRTVLVDNSPLSFLLQPANGIPCVPFKGGPGDEQLLNVILPLLECLSQLTDIRPVLNNHFKMATWFRARGYDVQLDF